MARASSVREGDGDPIPGRPHRGHSSACTVGRLCDRHPVRGSDVVNLLLDWLPKRWVQAGVFVLFAVMAVTHWYEPIIWYVFDKAHGLAEQLTPIMQNMIASIATPVPTLGAP